MRLREDYLNKIVWYLAEFLPTSIYLKNRIGLFDINNFAEDFFKDLLNEIYGTELINVNEIKANHPAIDLGDKKGRICFQITSDRDKEKIEHTLEQFRKYQLNKHYDDLRVFILTQKTKHRSQFSTIENVRITILDPGDILLDIKRLGTDKIKRVLDFLERELEPVKKTEPLQTLIQSEFHSEIDRIRDLIKSEKPHSALSMLENFKERNWGKCTDEIKYRLIANIGACYSSMGKYEEGAKVTIEALQYNPEDEKALFNASQAYITLGDKPKAKEYAEMAIKKNPLSKSGYACLILVSIGSSKPGEIEKTIPKQIMDESEIASAFSQFYLRENDLEKAIVWGELSLLKSKEKNPRFKGHLGSIILQHVSLKNNLDLTSRTNPEHYKFLNRAYELFDQAIEELSSTEIVDANLDIFTSRAICNHFKGNYNDAIEDFKFVIRKNPNDYRARRHLAFTCIHVEDLEGALAALEPFAEVGKDIQGSIMLADTRRMNKDLGGVIKICDGLMAIQNIDKNLIKEITKIKAAAYSEIENFPSSLDKIDELISGFTSDVALLNLKSKLLRKNGKEQEAKDVVLAALQIYREQEIHYVDKCFLAREVFDSRLYDDSIIIFEDVISRNPFHVDSKTLLMAYYNSGQFDKALAWLEVLNSNGNFDERTTEVEVTIYDKIGDLDGSIKACLRFLAANPLSLNIATRLGASYHRLGRTQELDELLKRKIEIDYIKERVDVVILFGNLLQLRGFNSTALEVYYELRRVHQKSSSKPHKAYFQFFLQRDHALDMSFNVSEVMEGNWVKYKIDEEEYELIVENRKKLVGSESNFSEPIVKVLLGKKIGEKFLVKPGIIPVFGEIIELKHKYVHAFQESMELLGSYFIEENSLQKFKIKEDFGKDGKLPVEMMAMLKAAEERNKKFEVHVQTYMNRKMSIGLLAYFGGHSILEQMEMLISNNKYRIITQFGLADEGTEYRLNLSKANAVVLDTTSSFTLHILGLLDDLKNTFSMVYTYQSVIDSISKEIQDRESLAGKGKGRLGIYSENGEVRKQIDSQEAIDKNIIFLKDYRDWMLKNAVICPVKGQLKFPKEQVENMEQILSEEVADSIYVASEAGACIICEDLLSKLIFKKEFKLNVASVKSLCDYMVQGGKISSSKYLECVSQMIQMGYFFTELSPFVLLHNLKESKFEVTEKFETTALLLGGGITALDGASDVVAQLFFEVWKDSILDFKVNNILLTVLSCFIEGRDNDEALEALKKKLHRYFFLLPVQEIEFLERIEAWNKTRVIK